MSVNGNVKRKQLHLGFKIKSLILFSLLVPMHRKGPNIETGYIKEFSAGDQITQAQI